MQELGRILREEREEREERGRILRAEREERGRRRQARLEAIRSAGGRATADEGGQMAGEGLPAPRTEEDLYEEGKEVEEEEKKEEDGGVGGERRDAFPSFRHDDDEGGGSGWPDGAAPSISGRNPPSILMQRRPPSISLRSPSALFLSPGESHSAASFIRTPRR